jgi:XFP N-terminal domain/Protein of unknown function (DUF2934)/Cation transporting ATPase, C-terminus
VFDNPGLIVACVVADGEAETGPLATSWQSTKFLDPITGGAVLPILHLNGYKIANPTVLARIEPEELDQLLRGNGWTPDCVEGHEPPLMHQAMAATLDRAVEEIRRIQHDARANGNTMRPRWPMIDLKSPKRWTGPKMVDGVQIEGTFRAHQIPLAVDAPHPDHLEQLEAWMRSYRPEELFDERGRLRPELADLAPTGERRMGANPDAKWLRVTAELPWRRKIFQRMNSYAMYRIAETLRVLLFMTLAILVFNFYPVTAVMIVMLALLNDGAILSIAYDNVHYKDKPEAWNMRMVLGISTVLGVIGVVAAFGLFYLGERVFHLDRAHIQTLMYLKLSVAGHLTIFLTRTRRSFWSIRPARTLWAAVLGTQIVATLIAVYGLFMTPLGWGWAGFVWGYALVWFLVNDRVKLLAYRVFDPTATPLLARRPLDLSPQIATRAYELYEQRLRGDSQADRDWLQAEREIRKQPPEAKSSTGDR